MSYYVEFSTYLNNRLLKLDRSATWLAKSLNVNPSTVARWLNGQTRPRNPELVIRMTDVLGIYDPKERQKILEILGYAYPGLLRHNSLTISNSVIGLQIVIPGEFPDLSSELLSAMRGALAGILNLSRQQIEVRQIMPP